MILVKNQWCVRLSPEFLGKTYLDPSLRLVLRLRRMNLRRRTTTSEQWRVLPHLYLRDGCTLTYIVRFYSDQWETFRHSSGGAESTPWVSGNEDVSTGVETAGQLTGRRRVVTRRLIPLMGAQIDVAQAFHSLSRSRDLLEQEFHPGNFVFKWEIYKSSLLTPSFFTTFWHLDHFVIDLAATAI